MLSVKSIMETFDGGGGLGSGSIGNNDGGRSYSGFINGGGISLLGNPIPGNGPGNYSTGHATAAPNVSIYMKEMRSERFGQGGNHHVRGSDSHNEGFLIRNQIELKNGRVQKAG
jgi:hypothetical protein